MAIIQTSGLISDIKGAVGGVVFQNTSAGIAVRQKVTPVNRRTLLQVTSRLKMFDLQSAWMALTPVQQADWELFAATYPKPQIKNTTKNINGHQYFLKYNGYRVRYGMSVLTTIDWSVPTLATIQARFQNFGGVLLLFASRRIDFANEFLVLFMSWETSPGINNISSRRRLISVGTFAGNLLECTASYTSVFGALPSAGSTIHVKCAAFSKNTPYWTAFYEAATVVASSYGVGSGSVGGTIVVRP